MYIVNFKSFTDCNFGLYMTLFVTQIWVHILGVPKFAFFRVVIFNK